jgi:ferredoxin-type protein NapH
MRAGLWTWRYIILRRLVQIGTLVLFIGTVHRGWKVAGAPLLRGDLSAYALLGGRVFCSWVCPVNPVADLAGWLRRRLGIGGSARIPRNTRYWILGLSLVLSALVGVAAFEWISPIGLLQRSLIFGLGLGWVAAAAIFILDLLVVRHGWCAHLCPLGAFYGLLGRVAQLRIAFDPASCTNCGDCITVCPDPHVLNLKRAAVAGMIASGDCTNCGRCTPVCPEGSLRFALRPTIRKPPSTTQEFLRARRAS